MKPCSIDDVRAVLRRMSDSAADAAQLAQLLPDMIARVPPPAAQLMSCPHFERATLWDYACSFENVAVEFEAPPENVRVQRDLWVRAIEVQVIPGIGFAQTPTLAQLEARLELFQRTAQAYGQNLRGLVELNWRVDGAQGFVSIGTSETMAIASLLTGDGAFTAPVDWTLQKDQVIEVRCRSRLADLFPALADDVVTPGRLRWVVVGFWAEALEQPSVR